MAKMSGKSKSSNRSDCGVIEIKSKVSINIFVPTKTFSKVDHDMTHPPDLGMCTDPGERCVILSYP